MKAIFVFLTLPLAFPAILLIRSAWFDRRQHLIPYRPRFLNWIIAAWGGLFWLSCPICGKNFGGHECAGPGLMVNFGEGFSTCFSTCRGCYAKSGERIDYECDLCHQIGEGPIEGDFVQEEIEHLLTTRCKGSLRLVHLLSPPKPEPPPLRYARE